MYFDTYANRSSGQFPDGTPIDVIANYARYRPSMGATFQIAPGTRPQVQIAPGTGFQPPVGIQIGDSGSPGGSPGTDPGGSGGGSPGGTTTEATPIWKNPYILAGVAIAAIILLK